MLGHGHRDYTGMKLVLFFVALFGGVWWLLSNLVGTFGRH